MIPNHRILLFGVLGSLGLLIVFLVLQGIASFFLQLPGQERKQNNFPIC